ncbi:hypothetical protein A2866_02490 [Candidatus Roizmanbacteria bacterium RIFCSPHIGHO2_01_FULL_39_8]|uniref:Uncharacterized protein n=2 Tax=Candidatus Roizmaniibacteriota TaxID=1752723 RepID=A0A1F7GIL9_9BACT|nr:MAG: hypothetical protein A2866_02490 [Candidatus Roizmanbacteria bacterium RIFCSPHIGHO2_01_FULL_39_8]OGK35273.1 MAG: hypothetical protein A3F60_00865 [Candidatus Roizmanbacteria bacterium RIFCSPHIGHO2_12_FULL_39_8]
MLKLFKNSRRFNLVKFFHLEKFGKPALFAGAICLFFITNLLISPLSLRIDLSKGKAYTLSESTKRILRNLTGTATINYFVSSDLPTRLLPLKTEVLDLLEEYRKEGRGKVQIKVLDPKKDQNALKAAQESGIPELQLSQLEKDAYSVSTSYFGATISYGTKKEVLPQITDIGNLEYNLIAAVYKMARKDIPKIGFVGTENTFNLQGDNLASLRRVLQQQFEIESVNLATDSGTTEISPNLQTLLVFDTRSKEYDPYELDLLKGYLQKKGNAVFFVDGVWVTDSLTTEPARHNLFPLLADYGIQIEKNLVLSSAGELVNFGNDQFSFLIPYPFWVKTDNFDKNSSYFSNIPQLMFPWVSSVKINGRTRDLIRTNAQSWSQAGEFTLNPQTIPQPQENSLKEFIISVQTSQQGKGTIVVIPSSRFVEERFLSNNSGNLEFVLNVVNDLSSGGALSGIRSRSVSFYPSPNLSEKPKDIFKYANILLLPLLFAVYGMVRLFKRR